MRYKSLPRVPGGIKGSLFVLNQTTEAFQVTLPANETFEFPLKISTASLLSPGKYEIQIQTSDPEEFAHTEVAEIPIIVQCPPPRPIWNFNIQPLVSPMGVNLGIILYWNACIVEAECCCPCKYEIKKNNKTIGTSTQLNYTDQTSLGQIGLQFDYEVTVIDFFGARSSINSCGSGGNVVVSSSSFDGLFMFIGIISILFFPFLFLFIERVREKRCERDWARYPQKDLLKCNEFLFRRITAPEEPPTDDDPDVLDWRSYEEDTEGCDEQDGIEDPKQIQKILLNENHCSEPSYESDSI